MEDKARSALLNSKKHLLNMIEVALLPIETKLAEWSKLPPKIRQRRMPLSPAELGQLASLGRAAEVLMSDMENDEPKKIELSDSELEAFCPQYTKLLNKVDRRRRKK